MLSTNQEMRHVTDCARMAFSRGQLLSRALDFPDTPRKTRQVLKENVSCKQFYTLKRSNLFQQWRYTFFIVFQSLFYVSQSLYQVNFLNLSCVMLLSFLYANNIKSYRWRFLFQGFKPRSRRSLYAAMFLQHFHNSSRIWKHMLLLVRIFFQFWTTDWVLGPV